MKKALRSAVIITCFLSAVFTLYYAFLPERTNSTAEVKLIDSVTDEKYRKDVLAEHLAAVNEKISEELKQIHESSQMHLLVIEDAIKTFGPYSKEVQNLVGVKDMQDSINLKKVTDIIDKHGWPGPDQIGAQNSYTLFTTIQNSDFSIQDKYIPVMKKAVASGSLSAEHFANFVDRKALVQHQKQIYGTVLTENKGEHSYSFAPIADEETVNQRRKDLGLCALEEYAKMKGVNHHGKTEI
jgi:hypothetical protein